MKPNIMDKIKKAIDSGLMSYLTRKGSRLPSTIASLLGLTGGIDSVGFINSEKYQIREGYKSVVWVYTAINLIADSCSRMKVRHYRRTGGEVEEVKDSRIVRLLEQPNNGIMSGQELSYAFHAFRLINGNGYILQAERGSISGLPVSLVPLASADVQPKLTTDGRIVYEYTGGKFKKTFSQEEVIQFQVFNPENFIEGMSPLGVARRTLGSNNKAKTWNEKLYENDARISYLLSIKSSLNPQSRKELRKALADVTQGMDNAGKIFVGEGDMSLTPMSLNPKDMDWVMQMKLTPNEVGTLYNVPVQLLNQEEGKTFANYEQAEKSFYINTAIPTKEKEIALYNQTWFNTGEEFLAVDRKSIPQIQEDESKLWGRIDASWEMTPNEKRKAKGLDELSDDGMNSVWVPNNLTRADMQGDDPDAE